MSITSPNVQTSTNRGLDSRNTRPTPLFEAPVLTLGIESGEQVDRVWQAVCDALAGTHPDLAHAAAMCATELVENALIHGRKHVFHPVRAVLQLGFRGEQLCVQVYSGIEEAQDLSDLFALVQQLSTPSGVRRRYASMARQALDQPPETSAGLGLTRCVALGEMTLSASVDEDVLTVAASRQWAGRA